MLLDLIKKHVGSVNDSPKNTWRPSYLRKRILILFVIAFSAIIAALEVLYQSSEAHDGIAASTESRHYLWTYGPTAILTIVATFWSRVEFQSKQNAPWQSMLEAPQLAEKSVLLDYISDMQPVAMWKAFKNKHLLVFSGVSCTLILQLMIVFSTGLFSLEEVQVHKQNVPIQVQNMFSTQNSTLSTVGSQPYDIVNGIAFENLTYPLGTNANLTFQEFSAPSLPSDAIITAPIDGVMADLSCESASLDVKSLEYMEQIDEDNHSIVSAKIVQHFRLTTPSCTVDNFSQLTLGDVEIKQSGVFQWGRCENTTGSDGTRVVVFMAEVEKKSISTNSTGNTRRYTSKDETISLHLNRSITLICRPTLSRVKLEAEGNATELTTNTRIRTLATEDENFPDLSAGDLAAFINDNVSDTSGFRSIEYFYPFPNNTFVDNQLKLGMLLIGEDTTTIETLWQGDALEKAAVGYYRGITAQLLHLGISHKKQSTVYGSARVNENRVLMMQLPLRTIEACLAVTILFTLGMLVLIIRGATATWNSAHISAIAAIMANSEDFKVSLRGAGPASNTSLRSHLVGKRYFSRSTSESTSIQIAEESRRHSVVDKIGADYHTWKPFPGLISRITIFILVCSAIAVLEILLHLSNTNDGLGNASPANEYTHYLWTVVPAGIMTGISLLFGSIDFNTRCLAPYAHLKRPTGATFQQSMSLSFLDSHGVNNSLRSARSGHFAVLATTLATGAAWFLTIVISGLYSAIEVPSHTLVNFTRVGGFPDPRTIAGVKLNMEETQEVAGILTSEYILQYNFSFPQWSYDEFAFANISIDEVSDKTTVNGSYVDIRVPALRAAPLCNLYTATDLKPNLTQYVSGSSVTYQLRVNMVTLACPGNNTDYPWLSNVFTVEKLEDGPFGYSIETDCHSDTGLDGHSHYTEIYVWGHVNSSSVKYIMAMNCMQFAETVDVLTRFKLPSMEIDETHLPVAVESTAKLVPDLYTPIPEWWALNTNGQYPTLDGFFYLLISGKYAIAVDDLMTSERNQTVIDAIKRQHKLINAQQFNNYTRSTANDSVEHAPLLGNITNTNRMRLVQDATSTRILEALLGAMLILGILGTALLNTDHVLPKNPCSVAAVASLLADSSLLDQFSQGAWNPSDKALSQTFAGRQFYLGWWENGSSDGMENGKVFTIDHTSATKEV